MIFSYFSHISHFSKIAAFSLGVLSASSLFAFSWPRSTSGGEVFAKSFGQNRAGTVSNGVVFQDESEVHTIDNGKIVAIISEHDDDMAWFESTLGTAIIVAHENQLCSVYANLDSAEIPEDVFTVDELDAGTSLGKTGKSNWHEEEAGLEFQIIDTKNQVLLNPRLILPRTRTEADKIAISNVTAVSAKGENYTFLIRRSLPSGTYKIYYDAQSEITPYKTTITINGVATETISYDTLQQYKGRLCASKKKFYPSEVLFPDSNRQLIGEVSLTRGKINLAIIVTDIFENEKATSFALDIN